ncbi:CAP domain-containing protein [Gorillibacterium sp. CAU 1737]|uniref:CAP domain-containing protein n=1 Tax=Gorillibacterium sp. CAU 1737 TaxID=3140362 RepID=UPI0032604C00
MLTHTKTARSKRRFFRRRVLAVALLVALLTGVSDGFAFRTASTTAHALSSDSSSYTADQLDALTYLNEVRKKVGLTPVRLDASLTKAALAHAAYYNQNKKVFETLSFHYEAQGTPGFTGSRAIDRMKAAGWTHSKSGVAWGEVMSFQEPNSPAAITSWLDTSYHRTNILNPLFDQVGIGIVGGTVVMDLGGPGTAYPIEGGISVYPYDGMTAAPIGFYGNEVPNPLEQFQVDYSGYVVSAVTSDEITAYRAVIKDEAGKEVPFFHEQDGENTVFLYPKKILTGYHTYTVTLNYQIAGSSAPLSKTWSFKTGKGQTLTYLLALQEEVMVNEGGKASLLAQGIYNDEVRELLTNGVRYSSSAKELQVSSQGVVTATKAGTYKVTATAGEGKGKKATFTIKVYPKWKTKSYAVSSVRLPSVATKHPLKSSIEWGLRNGIVAAGSDGLLRPDTPVSEAEFLTMFLKAYKVNIGAYAPKKVSHWADAAYVIAKDRNFPLSGIAKPANRNTPIQRLRIAELVSAADGLNFTGWSAVQYVLGHDYIKGKTGSSLDGFEAYQTVTKAEALDLLQHLQKKLIEVKGRPVDSSAKTLLPAMPPEQLYAVPAVLPDGSLYAQFRKDRTLVVDGRFSEFAGQTLTFRVQENVSNSSSKAIEDIPITLDSQGRYHLETGPYSPAVLNLFLETGKVIYGLTVYHNTINGWAK